MLHELLFSLYGHSQYLPAGKSSYAIIGDDELSAVEKNFADSFSFMHPSEKEIVKRILEIALYYKQLENFINSYGLHPSHGNSVDKVDGALTGHYLTAFAAAVSEETIPYKNEIVNIEEKVVREESVPLSKILLHIQPFLPIFKEFNYIICMIHKDKLQGCKILELVHHRVISTVGSYHEALKRAEKNILKVFLDQLMYWMIYGELLDCHRELFLQPVQTEQPSDDAATSLHGESTSSSEVSLYVEMLPDFVDLATAEKILFIGESVRFYEKGGKSSEDKMALISKNCLILRKKEEEFLTEFTRISSQNEFSVKQFAELVELVRECISERLYTLVNEAGLVDELMNVKKIFLLGRGELYQAFFGLADKFLKQPSPHLSKMEFNALFQKAGRQVLLEEEFMEKFSLTYQRESGGQSTGCAWNHFRVDYNVKWPLHEIFRSRVMEKYNTILRFLFNVQRAQYRLQHLWVTQKETKNATLTDKLEMMCWTLRHHMSHLINNFQYYIQVDVLDSQYCWLMEEISATRDYQRLSVAHNSFLTSVMTHCYLSHPLLSSTINTILDQVHSFCTLMEAPNILSSRRQLEEVEDDFKRVSSKFFMGLKLLAQQRESQFTSQLVTRIDYNNYYSKRLAAQKFSAFQS